MKKNLLLLSLLCTISVTYSQYDYPNSIVTIGAGLGPNYGGIGTKTIIGYKNSGLLIGLGIYGGNPAYELGGQISARWWYANLGYGAYGVLQDEYSGDNITIYGGNILTGGMINLGKTKRTFIDVGIGYSWGGSYTTFYGQVMELTGMSGVLGIGYRINKKP